MTATLKAELIGTFNKLKVSAKDQSKLNLIKKELPNVTVKDSQQLIGFYADTFMHYFPQFQNPHNQKVMQASVERLLKAQNKPEISSPKLK